MYFFGIDIGGTYIKLGFFKNEKLIHKFVIKTNENGELILKDIANEIKFICKQMRIDITKIVGIGLGVPAQINKKGIVKLASNIGWTNKNVVKELNKLTNINVIAGNDASLAALGEIWQGSAKGHKNIIAVTLGTGVGSGIIIDEKLYCGENGFSGEMGHMCINFNETEVCHCGQKGCLEQYFSSSGLIKLAKQELNNSNKKTMVDPNDITVKQIFELAHYGDVVATQIVDTAVDYLAIALANTAMIIDPDIIVIGGGLSKAGDTLLDPLRLAYKRRALHANKNTRIVLSSLQNDAGMYGAAKLILDQQRN